MLECFSERLWNPPHHHLLSQARGIRFLVAAYFFFDFFAIDYQAFEVI